MTDKLTRPGPSSPEDVKAMMDEINQEPADSKDGPALREHVNWLFG